MVVVAAVRMKKVAVVVVRGIGLVMVVMMVGMRLEQQQQRGARKWQRRGPRERERGLGTKERRAAVAVGSGFGRGRWAACRLVGWLVGRREEAARERVKGALELGVEIRRRRRVIRVRQSLRLKYDTKPQF